MDSLLLYATKKYLHFSRSFFKYYLLSILFPFHSFPEVQTIQAIDMMSWPGLCWAGLGCVVVQHFIELFGGARSQSGCMSDDLIL